MYLGRAYLDVTADIDAGGFPQPRFITLEGGRRLAVMGVMHRGAVTTAAGVSAFRYELWIGDSTYVLYLDNTVPLRWYVDVALPFKAEPRETAFWMRPALSEAADCGVAARPTGAAASRGRHAPTSAASSPPMAARSDKPFQGFHPRPFWARLIEMFALQTISTAK